MPARARRQPTQDEKDAGGRLVKKAVYINDEYGRGHLYDVDDFMSDELAEANNVGPHIFSDDLTPGDQELTDQGWTLSSERS
jgi:hypothetical protein